MAKSKSKTQKARRKSKKIQHQSVSAASKKNQRDTRQVPLSNLWHDWHTQLTNRIRTLVKARQFKLNNPAGFIYAFLLILMLISSIVEIHNLDLDLVTSHGGKPSTLRLTHSYDALKNLKGQTASLTAEDKKYNLKLINSTELWSKLDAITIKLATGNAIAASQNIRSYSQELKKLQSRLSSEIDKKNKASIALAAAAHASTPTTGTLTAPILIYHYTPADFDRQLSTLQAKGYNAITMDNLSDYLRFDRPLPPKPVVITFDDGFKDQMQAFTILKRHNMKATFYIITGGETSHWCIGAGRHYDQTPSCGNDYLNWDEIHEFDRSGLIEIAAHTVDHLALATKSQEVQQFQISQSKKIIEAKLGHPIHHFAYPYGSFSRATADIVKASGYSTAVTTQPGSTHSPDSIYTLTRVRDAYALP